MEYEYNNLKMKVEQGQTHQEDPALLRLQQQLETQAAETRKLTAELATQKESTLLERIARIEQHAGGPSPEQIQRYIDQSIQAEHDKVTASDLDRKIKEAINASQGVSTIDVEMKKIDKQYDIDQRKLEMEEKKGNMWGDTLKDVAGLVGEGIGKSMSGAEPEPQTQTPPVSCPHCGTPLMLPPGVKFGVCPKCNGKMEIGAGGIPSPFTEPSTPQKPPLETEFEPRNTPPFNKPPESPLESDKEPAYTGTFNKPSAPFNKPPEEQLPPEEPLGLCPKCGKPVFDSNIGKTENGQPYHKECC
jgi:Zn finger protein HypA/HybF involved in hydrogenase expression